MTESYEDLWKQVELSLKIQLLHYLPKCRKVVSKEQIFSAIWGADFTDIGISASNWDKIDKKNRYIKTMGRRI